MLRKKITGAKYFSDSTKQMTNLNIATPIDKKDTNFSSSDILLAKDIVELTSNTNSEDIDKLKTSVASINEQITNDQKNITKNSNDISTLNSKFTGLFEVVNTLPNVNDAELGKIYCIKDTSSSSEENKYTEWVKIKTANNTYKFEKIGEFNAAPDLSGYAKLNANNVFTGNKNSFNALLYAYTATIGYIIPDNNKYLKAKDTANQSNTKAFVSNGELANIGTAEALKFTLEDGSIITKNIRVISTTTA